jgi:hypothetical protein
VPANALTPVPVMAVLRRGVIGEAGSGRGHAAEYGQVSESMQGNDGSHGAFLAVGVSGSDSARSDIALEDLEDLGMLGSGSSGVVRRVRHRRTGEDNLVLKVIQADFSSEAVRKQVGRCVGVKERTD